MWPGAVSLCSLSQKAPHTCSSCTGLGGVVLLSMFLPLHSLLRVSRGRALWVCPPNSVLPTGESLTLPVLKLQVHGQRGVGTLGSCPPLPNSGSAAAPFSHFSSLFIDEATPPPPPPGIPLQGGWANVFVGRRRNLQRNE